MKQAFFIVFFTLTLPFVAKAQSYDLDDFVSDNIVMTKVVDMYNAEFQWDEFKEKTGKAIIKNDYIELEAKKEAVTSCTELPINMKDDIFVVRLYMIPDKIDNNGYVGIVFDKTDSENYKMFTISKKSYEISYVKDGKKVPKHRGLYKSFPYNPELDNGDIDNKNTSGGVNERKQTIQLPKTKDILVFKIGHRGNTVTFSVNGLELYKIKNINLDTPSFGYIASEGHKLRGYGLIFTKKQKEEIDD